MKSNDNSSNRQKKTSEAQLRANAKYDAAHMTKYTVKYSNQLYDKVLQAMADTGLNRNAWTTRAIREKLERDGYLESQREEEKKGEEGNRRK